MQDGRIPLTVITGFLGAGKTTLLNALLRQTALARTAVIINEFGEIGIDADLVERGSEDVIEMRGGCLCCTIRGDLSRTIAALNLKRIKGEVVEFVRLVVETTGLADPAPILQTLMGDPVVDHDFRLEGVVTVVDALNGGATLDAHAEAVKQAAVADRIVVTKADLVPRATLEALEERLSRLNPGARIVRMLAGQAPAADLLDNSAYDPKTKTVDVERWLSEAAYDRHGDHKHPHHHDHEQEHELAPHDPNRHDAHIRAFAMRRSAPIAGSAASLFLELLTAQRGANLLRVKGILNIEETPDRPLVIHAVQHVVHAPIVLDAWPSADRDSRIVFITRDLERAAVDELLDALMTVRLTIRQPGPR